MKRFVSVIMTVALLCAVFVLPSAASSDLKNAQVDVPYIDTAPIVDGVIGFNEYGDSAVHSLLQNSSQFTDDGAHNTLDNIRDIQFYMSWTEEYLYLGWVVETDVHTPFPKGTYEMAEGASYATLVSQEWPESEEEQAQQLGNMWMFSCVQFTIVPGVPDCESDVFMTSKNYLSVGVCEMDDGSIGNAVWNVPMGVEYSEIEGDDWEASVVRDDDAGTTTYEVAVHASMCGVSKFENNVSIGLGYAVAAQEHYYEKGTSMIEWQDSILSWPALPDNSGVLTFVGAPEKVIVEAIDEGAIDEDATVSYEEVALDLESITLPENISEENIKVCNISLLKGEETVQPNGKVKVSILAPKDIEDIERYKIWNIDEEGNFTDMNAVCENGYYVFETDLLGCYAIAAESRFRGDVNNDGEVDKKDYAALKRYCFETITLDEASLLAADVNNDGEVDKKDYASLKRYCFNTWVIETPYV